MSGRAADRRRFLQVTAGNLRQSHLYVHGQYDFFPADCIGPPRRSRSDKTKPISIMLDGLNRTVETDIGTEPKTGKPRRFFRGRKWVREFFEFHGIVAGDVLGLERLATHSYRLSRVDAGGDRRFAAGSVDLLAYSVDLQKRYEASTSPEDRKRRGQFFTPPGVARFMGNLLCPAPGRFRLLDPGAGIGMLSAAVCERVLQLRSPRDIQVHLYETDSRVVPLLHRNMEHCGAILKRAGHRVSHTIHNEDFILSNSHALGQRLLFDALVQPDAFDAIIMNPPYFKIAKSCEYARIMHRVIHGQPNIYGLFMALAAQLLRPGGKLVAITPRSFCNGLYFRSFREWFFSRMSPRRIHLFESRTETFRAANVLQESVVTLTERSQKPPPTVAISTSFGGDLQQMPPLHHIATDKVIDDTCGQMVVRIPENRHDAQIIDLVEAWPARFADHGLRVSTGPVVMFRARQFLLQSANGQKAVPLLSAHNVRPFETVWPVPRANKPTGFRVCDASRRLLVPAANYVLLRRFSAKEERRRLTASCFFKRTRVRRYLALENHLNYVYHEDRELTEEEVYGLAALFNSPVLDRYFRMISGNTQVNAAELRTMKLPDLRSISLVGTRVRALDKVLGGAAESAVLDALGVTGTLKRYLAELGR